jgi:DNA-binding HxlR family transcriptional regulator
MLIIKQMKSSKECIEFIRPVRDVLDIINGKWKLPILIALSLGNRRFKELERDVEGITPRMLSKELRDLEVNQLIIRKVYDTIPVTVEYSLSEYGKSLDHVIVALRTWGQNHRNKLFGRMEEASNSAAHGESPCAVQKEC